MQVAPRASPPIQGAGNGPAIVVQNLVISYGSLRAVDDLSFSVQRREIFALLGPNGAGKTSTVEILEGYRRPDSGTVRVLDYDPISQGHEMKEHIGLMLQQTPLYEKIKVREAIDLFTSYYDHPKPAAELIELAGLQKHRDAAFDSLSGSQKQRLSLALAMAGNPRVAFLDEPTASLAPQSRLQTWELIQGLRQSGVTVLLTTHYMEEAQHLADHVAIIDHGKLVALGTPEEDVSALFWRALWRSDDQGHPSQVHQLSGTRLHGVRHHGHSAGNGGRQPAAAGHAATLGTHGGRAPADLGQGPGTEQHRPGHPGAATLDGGGDGDWRASFQVAVMKLHNFENLAREAMADPARRANIERHRQEAIAEIVEYTLGELRKRQNMTQTEEQ